MIEPKAISSGQGRRGVALLAALRDDWQLVLFGAAMILGIAARASLGWTWPFWFDETFSGVIASQPTFAKALDWCLHEMTGPSYYLPLWAWEKIAGSSDVALRLPSLICSLAAPVIVYRWGHPDRTVRALWATMLVLWIPVLGQASEARGYAWLVLLAASQAAFFLRLMHRPGTRIVFFWAAASALMVTTNYFSVAICGMQGIVFLTMHRGAALRTWPAALVFVPMLAWMSVHLPFVLGYATSPSSFYKTLPPSAVFNIPGYILGSNLHATIVFAAIAIGLVQLALDGRRARTIPAGLASRSWRLSPEPALVLASILACTIFFVTIFTMPTFVMRYLTPTIPSLLFAIAWWGRKMIANGRSPALLMVLAMFFIMTTGAMRYGLAYGSSDTRYTYNLDQPSHWLMRAEPKRMVFFWDSPTGVFSDGKRLAEVGGFFFHRDGMPIVVDVARVGLQDDTNTRMLSLANAEPDTVLLWLVTDDADPSRLPAIAKRDKRWLCHTFGGNYAIIEACYRRSRL